jgi:16S rRNA processing protein RimM
MRYVGTIRSILGNDGHVVLGDAPPNLRGFAAGTELSLGYSPAFATAYRVRSCEARASKDFALLLEGIANKEQALTLREMGVFASEALLRASVTSEFLEDDLLGCAVFNVETGDRLGELAQVWYMPANDVWVVDVEGKELPIPAVDAFIKRVNLKTRRVDVFVMDGLMDLLDTSAPAPPDDDRD